MIASVAMLSHLRVLRWIAGFYIDLFRTTPALIQLIWFYYALPILIGQSMTSLQAGILGLTLFEGSYMTEVFRSGIMSVRQGQIDAGMSVGMKPWQVFRVVVLPQAVIRMLPPFTGQALTLFKDSSILSIISVSELLWHAESILPITLHTPQVLTVVAFLYFVIGFPLALLSTRLHRKLSFD
jgi:polar amino acid transport system permease protein